MTTRERHPAGRDYQLMVSALADVARRRDAELAGADRAYQDSAAQAAGELTRAEQEAASADRWAGAAASAVLDVDREAARLWDQLRRTRGMRVRAIGELPDPAPVEELPRMAIARVPDSGAGPDTARTLLTRTAERIDDSVRRVPRRPLPRWTLPLLPIVGALAAAAAALVAAGLVTLGETGITTGPLLRTLGWLAFLAAPSAGIPIATLMAHRELNARLDIGGIALTLLGGMTAATTLSLTFAAR